MITSEQSTRSILFASNYLRKKILMTIVCVVARLNRLWFYSMVQVTWSSDPNMLLSGSQDGTMKYFDIRVKVAVNTFVRY